MGDHNEFVSSRGGWLGNWDQLLFFHWVNPMQTLQHWSEIKIADLTGIYEVALSPSIDVHAPGALGSLSRLIKLADADSLLAPLRQLLLTMKAEKPPSREVCW